MNEDVTCDLCHICFHSWNRTCHKYLVDSKMKLLVIYGNLWTLIKETVVRAGTQLKSGPASLFCACHLPFHHGMSECCWGLASSCSSFPPLRVLSHCKQGNQSRIKKKKGQVLMKQFSLRKFHQGSFNQNINLSDTYHRTQGKPGCHCIFSVILKSLSVRGSWEERRHRWWEAVLNMMNLVFFCWSPSVSSVLRRGNAIDRSNASQWSENHVKEYTINATGRD